MRGFHHEILRQGRETLMCVHNGLLELSKPIVSFIKAVQNVKGELVYADVRHSVSISKGRRCLKYVIRSGLLYTSAQP